MKTADMDVVEAVSALGRSMQQFSDLLLPLSNTGDIDVYLFTYARSLIWHRPACLAYLSQRLLLQLLLASYESFTQTEGIHWLIDHGVFLHR